MGTAAGGTLASTTPVSPYIGLSYYTEADAEWFFGRDAECETIVANLRASPLTILYAESGVGKSSLLRAGVATRLHEMARRRLVARGSPGFVPVVFSAWKDDPVDDLIDAIETAVRDVLPAGQAAALPRDSLASAAQAAAEATGAKLLIVLDQFEEYMLYKDREPAERRFVDELGRCVNRVDLRMNVLIAIREDAYSALGDLFAGKVANVYGNHLQLAYLDRDSARATIVKPLEHFNRVHDEDEPIEIEPALVEAVLDQVRTGEVVLTNGVADGTPAATKAEHEEIETPYLQLVMSALWAYERSRGSRLLRLATLEELGGAQQIVRSHLEGALAALPEDERDAAVAVFGHLVTPSGTKIVHAASDLAQMTSLPDGRIAAVLEKLAQGEARIVRHVPPPAGRTTPNDRYEIFHDVLAPAIVSWRAQALHDRARAADAQQRARLQREKQEAEATARAERTRARRFRALAAVAVILLIASVVAFVLARVATDRAHHAERVASSRQLAAEAQADLEGGVIPRGALLSLVAYRTSPTSDARSALVRSLEATEPMIGYISVRPTAVSSVAFSPDGRTLASARVDGTVSLSTVRTSALLRTLNNTSPVDTVTFSPDGRILATGDDAGNTTLWDPRTGRRLTVLAGHIHGHTDYVNSAAFSPDGRTLASAMADGRLIEWNVRSGSRIRTFNGPRPGLYDVTFSPDGSRVAVAAGDGTVRVWDGAGGRPVLTLRDHRGAVHAVAFSPDGAQIASGGVDGPVLVQDSRTGRRVLAIHHAGPVTGISFSPDGSTVATSSDDHTASLWDAHSGRRLAVFRGDTDRVGTVAFSPDGTAVATGSDDGSVILWAAHSGLEVRTVTYPQATLCSVYSPDGRLLATGTSAGTVVLADAATGRQLRVLVTHAPSVATVAFSPDGRQLAAPDGHSTIAVFDVKSGARLRVLSGHRGTIWSIAFSPDGRVIAAGGDDGTVILWDARSGRAIRTLRGHSDAVYSAAFSPSGDVLASGSGDDSVIVWDVATGHLLRRLVGHSGPVEAVAFSPDGRILASAGDDRSIILWNPNTGQRIGDPLLGHADRITSISWSADGGALASGSNDGTVILWNLATRLGATVVGRPAPVESVDFAPGGRALAAASLDHTVTLVSSPHASSFAAISDRICAVARRSLTMAEWHRFGPDSSFRRTCG